MFRLFSKNALLALGGRIMELLIPLAVVAVWILLQVVILPSLGVPT